MNEKVLMQVLNEALLDEYKARDTYRKIINTFGAVRPFVNIVEAEQRHIEFLLPLYQKYSIPLPPEPDPEQIVVPESLMEACKAGVAEEIENVSMYDRLIEMTDLPDVIEVLQRLQAASRDNHLPAFQRCVERGGETGNGRGRGRLSGEGRGPGRGPGRGRRGNN
tara:strand:- start:113219 stop:113713 length:495 start_codon:yes stop_codon:yes gene_type:complete